MSAAGGKLLAGMMCLNIKIQQQHIKPPGLDVFCLDPSFFFVSVAWDERKLSLR